MNENSAWHKFFYYYYYYFVIFVIKILASLKYLQQIKSKQKDSKWPIWNLYTSNSTRLPPQHFQWLNADIFKTLDLILNVFNLILRFDKFHHGNILLRYIFMTRARRIHYNKQNKKNNFASTCELILLWFEKPLWSILLPTRRKA